jgi:HK97 family phage major capsid protein
VAITLKGVYSALKAEGYTGPDSDATALAKFALDNEITIKGNDGVAVDIVKLGAPAKVAKSVTIAADEPVAAPAVNIDEAVQKAIAGIEAKIVKGFAGAAAGRPNFAGEFSVKSGDERRYDTKIKSGQAVYKDYSDALAMGNWFASRVNQGQGKFETAKKFWGAYAENATRKGFSESTMEAGGATIPGYLEADVQELALSYGLARKLCRYVRTNTDTYSRPRVAGDIRFYYPGEAAAGTDDAANRVWDQIKGTVKKGYGLAKVTKELQADSVVDIMEDAMRSLMRSATKIEDDSLFNGTGAGAASPATYIPGVTGIVRTFGTTATDDSRSVTGGDTMAAHTLANLMTLMGLPGNFGGGQNNVFICSPVALTNILFRLGLSQGGATYAEYANFGAVPRILGRPVIVTEVMNKTVSLGSDLTDVLYGDVSLAATFVERQGIEIDVSEHVYWTTDEVGVKCTVRHDINVHDLGSTTAQGPLGSLFQT